MNDRMPILPPVWYPAYDDDEQLLLRELLGIDHAPMVAAPEPGPNASAWMPSSSTSVTSELGAWQALSWPYTACLPTDLCFASWPDSELSALEVPLVGDARLGIEPAMAPSEAHSSGPVHVTPLLGLDSLPRVEWLDMAGPATAMTVPPAPPSLSPPSDWMSLVSAYASGLCAESIEAEEGVDTARRPMVWPRAESYGAGQGPWLGSWTAPGSTT
ncbi:hypothetical protein MNAN1_002595 [Malassezia nana]|uniref:Uncharacterized protein n=1 Tax=Malassezia nana TaxID=180528 RepID=A0AAF0J814_9BASI|nr:hypothetical protein MNAN1_002595 [Malassezia nana]